MAFTEFIKGQFIDVIEYVEQHNKLLVYKYTRYGNEIKQGANLIVRNGQIAVFVHRGQIADIFVPGNYKLNTGNLPILSNLKAVTSLFNSPIKSDLYFVNTTYFINNKWHTKNPILMRDTDMNMVRITSFGTFSFVITDVRLFMNEIFGARMLNMTYEIVEFLKSFVSEAVASAIGESGIPVLDLAVKYRSLSNIIEEYVNNKSRKFGICISELAIENVSLPKEVEKLIDEQSGIGMASKNMGAFMQYQTARAMRDASKQEGGLAGLGAGFVFGSHIADTLSSNINTTVENKEVVQEQENTISVADKLLKYKELLDKGVLTQEEYEEVKQMILKEL